MNAIELADELEQITCMCNYGGIAIENAVVMLRQQQVKITDYEKCTKHMATRIVKYSDEIEVLKATLTGRDKYIDLIMESYEKGINHDRE